MVNPVSLGIVEDLLKRQMLRQAQHDRVNLYSSNTENYRF